MKTFLRIALLYALMLSFLSHTIAQTNCGWQQGEFITRTQAGYNALTDWFGDYNSAYASTFGVVEIGINGANGYSAAWSNPTAIQSYLIASGTPTALSGDLFNPTVTSSGVFCGEVLCLQLNVDLSDNGMPFGSLLLKDMDDATLNGLTVADFLNLVNQMLGGNNANGYSYEAMNTLTTQLNASFAGSTPTTFAQDHLRKGWKSGDLYSLSQGGWDDLNNWYWYPAYDEIYYPTGIIEVGIPGSAGFSIRFTGADRINDFFIQTGTPAILNADLIDPTSSVSRSFGGEVLALRMNIDFSDFNKLPISTNYRFGDLILYDITSAPEFNGMSVRNLLSISQTLLGGGNASVAFSEFLVELISRVNAAFTIGTPTPWAQLHLKKGWQQGDMLTRTQQTWNDLTGWSVAFNDVYTSTFGVVEVGIPGLAGFSMRFSTTLAVQDYLIASGTPAVLDTDLLNPISSSSGSFGGEVLVLQLNVDFAANGTLGGSSGIAFGNLMLYNMDDTTLNGLTVSEVLAIANQMLGGNTTTGYSFATMNMLASQLNGAFSGGGVSTFAQEHLLSPCDVVPPSNTPPMFVSPTPTCGSTIEAKVGLETTFTIQASDTDAGDFAALSVSGLPAGATLNPALPTDSTVFTWTPDTNGQVTITFTATDNSNETATCELTINVTTCPEGGGFWKNNPDAWPLQSLMLGTNSYTQAQLTAILDMPVGIGNKADASLILCRQLIPAKLSVASGAIVEPWLPTAIANADALIGSNTIPMKTKANSTLGKQMTAIASQFETFNNGSTTSGCGTVTTAAMVAMRSASDDTLKTPSAFSLEQNIPNPFSESTIIRYGLPEDSYVQLAIYNFIGQHVRTLANGRQAAGYRQVEFNAGTLADGIYFCRMQAGDFTSTIKLVLMK